MMTAREHNRLLGIFFLIHGGLQAMGAIFMLFLFPVMFATMPEFKNLPPDFPRGFFVGIMIFAVAFSLLFALPPLAAGFGFFKVKPWARTAGFVAGILALLSIPLGTALGVYTLWFLQSEQGKQFYMYGGGEAPLPPPPPETWK
ncbi:MAG TPA: hypothetical protein VF507_05145 [Pyrinomonadaceae bacterium]|jgi:hypothetical protein